MDFKPKTYRISSVWSILLEISHLSFLCQLKVLGHFAKNWFGKKIPVAVQNIFQYHYRLVRKIKLIEKWPLITSVQCTSCEAESKNGRLSH